MRISDTGSTSFTRSSTSHEANKIQDGLVRILLLVLIIRQALFQELINDKMYHCFTNSPPGGSQTLPEAKEASFSMNPSYHHRKTAVGSVKLESGLHQPNGIRGTRADESWKNQTLKINFYYEFPFSYPRKLPKEHGQKECHDWLLEDCCWCSSWLWNNSKSRLLWREQHQLDWVLDLCTDLLHLHLTKCA